MNQSRVQTTSTPFMEFLHCITSTTFTTKSQILDWGCPLCPRSDRNFRLSNPKASHSVSSGNHSQGSYPQSTLLFIVVALLCGAPSQLCLVWLVLGSVNNKSSFQRNCLLIRWSHKIWTIKQLPPLSYNSVSIQDWDSRQASQVVLPSNLVPVVRYLFKSFPLEESRLQMRKGQRNMYKSKRGTIGSLN